MSHIEERSWDEFRQAGLLWWINRQLHLFGWAVAVEIDEENRVKNVYPARCTFRGFSPDSETEGFTQLTTHLQNEAAGLMSKDDHAPPSAL